MTNRFTFSAVAAALCFGLLFWMSPNANAQLSGSYTINAGGTASATVYEDFASFFSDLNFGTRADGGTANGPGVSGAVTATVTAGSGPYNEQVSLNAVTGASATNTITIDGNGETLEYNPTSWSARHILRLNGADYITIDDLVIERSGTGSYCWAVHLMNFADNNTITNCEINANSGYTTSSNYMGIIMNNSTTSWTSGNSNDNNTFTNNVINYGYCGIYSRGAGSAISSMSDGCIADNNEINDCYNGIYLYWGNNDWEVTDNTINDCWYGFYGYYYMDNSMIDGNEINDCYYGIFNRYYCDANTVSNNTLNKVVYFYPVYFYSNNNTVEDNMVDMDLTSHSSARGTWATYYTYAYMGYYYCDNNLFQRNNVTSQYMGIYGGYYYSDFNVYQNNCITMVNGGNTSSYRYGLYAYPYYGTNNLWTNNSVAMEATMSNSYGVYSYAYPGSAGNNDFVNNSIQGNRAGGMAYFSYGGQFGTIDHNNWHNKATGSLIGFGSSGSVSYYADLAAFQTGTVHGDNGREGDPGYNNPPMSFLPVGVQLEDGGSQALSGGLTDDAMGNTRPAVAGDSIDIGCIEFEPPAIDLAEVRIDTPTTNQCYGNAEDICVLVRGTGTDTFDFANSLTLFVVEVTGATTATLTSGLISSGKIAPGEEMAICMTSTLDMSTSGVYNFKTYHTVVLGTADGYDGNDTAWDVRNVTAPITTYPWLEDFEGFTVSTSWEGAANDAGYDNGWQWLNGDYPLTPEDGSGYIWRQNNGIDDHTYECGTTAGTYMMVEASTGGWPAYYDATSEFGMTSPCLDLSGLTCPRLEFWHQGWNNNIADARGDLFVDVSGDAGVTWDSAVYTIQEGMTHDAAACLWTQHSIDMSNYVGNTVRVRFRMNRANSIYDGGFTCYYGDQAIDDVSIYNVDTQAVVTAVELPEGCSFGTDEDVMVYVFNGGCDTLISGDWSVSVSVSGPTTDAGVASLPAVPPGDTVAVTISGIDFSGTGLYNVDGILADLAFTYLDLNTGNALQTEMPIAPDEYNPYMEDFETDTGGWVSVDLAASGGSAACETCASGGGGSTVPGIWQWGEPNQTSISGASSGTKAWMTDTAANYPNTPYLLQTVTSGCFDFSCMQEPMVQFEANWDMDIDAFGTYAYDGVRLEYSTDLGVTWMVVGSNTSGGTNWYDVANMYSWSYTGYLPGQFPPAWSDNSGGWVSASHDLSNLAGEPAVKFRFIMATDYSGNDEGFAFDDFEIFDNFVDSASNTCDGSPAVKTDDKSGSTIYPVECCCETADATEDPATVPSCWSDGFDNSVYFPIRTSAALGHRTLNIIMQVTQSDGMDVQAALYGPFTPGACPGPTSWGTPVRCVEGPGPFLAMSGVIAYDPDEIYYLVVDGEMGQCAVMNVIPFGTALPVELLNFDVSKVGSDALLSWTTASETNNDYFSIERSANGVDFVEIGTVDGSGTTTEEVQYSFTDRETMSGLNYYRLRQVDFDGNFEYSDIRVVEFSGAEGVVSVAPNPFSGNFEVTITSALEGEVAVVLTDVIGRVIYSETVSVSAGSNTLTLELGDEYAKGVYMLNVEGLGIDELIKMVKEE